MMAKLKKMKWCSMMLIVLMVMMGFAVQAASAGEYIKVYDGGRHVGNVEYGESWTGGTYIQTHPHSDSPMSKGSTTPEYSGTMTLIGIGAMILFSIFGGGSSSTSNSSYNQSYGR